METIALVYDFDGTLAPGNMQEYDFIPAVGKSNKEFWSESNRLAEEQDADMILAYMDGDQESAILKELHGFRSDDFIAKSEAYTSIQDKGYVSLDEITTTDNTGKMTLNLVNTYLLGCMIKSDLITESYVLPSSV